MSSDRLRKLLFWTLCCDCGLFAKQLISPAANLITDALRIPGGVGTAFSIMFLVIAAEVMPRFGCAALMGLVQSMTMLALGRVGSMGVLSPLGYIVPALAVDAVMRLMCGRRCRRLERMIAANAAGSVFACLTANLIVFRLRGSALLLYVCIAALSGIFCGWLGERIARKVKRAVSVRSKEQA